jgi:hypothetical protein
MNELSVRTYPATTHSLVLLIGITGKYGYRVCIEDLAPPSRNHLAVYDETRKKGYERISLEIKRTNETQLLCQPVSLRKLTGTKKHQERHVPAFIVSPVVTMRKSIRRGIMTETLSSLSNISRGLHGMESALMLGLSYVNWCSVLQNATLFNRVFQGVTASTQNCSWH